jgi:Domain of unknown function (DUF4132)
MKMDITVKIGVDGFPIDLKHIYVEQHLAIDPIIAQALGASIRWEIKIHQYPATQFLLKQDHDFQLATIFSILDRLTWLETIASAKSHSEIHLGKATTALSQLLGKIIARDLNYQEADLLKILEWCLVDYLQRTQCLNRYGLELPRTKIFSQIEKHAKSHPLSKEFTSLIHQSYALGGVEGKIERILMAQSQEIDLSKIFTSREGEIWADTAMKQIDQLQLDEKEKWSELILHASTAIPAKPTVKWLKTAQLMLDGLGVANFKSRISEWFELLDGSPTASMSENNRLILTGLLWFYSLIGDEMELELIANLTMKCYKKIRGIGPFCHKAGNAGLWLLGELNTFQAIDCMGKMHRQIKNQAIQTQIEKYLNLAAQKTGLSREDLEELAIPAYNLSLNGTLQQHFGLATANVKILDTKKTELSWLMNGKPQKSVPAIVKTEFPTELKTLKRTIEDINKTLSTQRERIERMYLIPRSWDYKVWCDRYLNHPVLSNLTRRLIWSFKANEKIITGIWRHEKLVDMTGTAIEPIDSNTTVTLWHPIESSIETVLSWRLLLEEQEIVQLMALT